MDAFLIAEIAVAVPAGILVAVSLGFKNQKKFRVTNLVGSVLFLVYGVVLAIVSSGGTGWTTIVLNALGSGLHLYHLFKKQVFESKKEFPCRYSGKGNIGVCYKEGSQYYECDCVHCEEEVSNGEIDGREVQEL